MAAPLDDALAMGCMALSTNAARDDDAALALLAAALESGVTLLDTADAYCLDDADVGHNERLIARALAAFGERRARVAVATKGGLVRPGGRWVPDGRARHLAAACEASRAALGVERLELYQLHVPDPRVPIATSARALAALERAGLVARIGLCNVGVVQLEQACAVAPIASVAVELGPLVADAARGGVVERCRREGIALIAHRPFGGARGARALARDPLLVGVAARLCASVFEVVLAWLRGLALVPLPGPTRVETARSLARAAALVLPEPEREALDRHFPLGALLRRPRVARRPLGSSEREVVLLMGYPAAGKSRAAEALVERGWLRLNRDARGGRLADLVRELARELAGGAARVVLDNTYAKRAARNEVVEAAWRHGVPVRCVWLQTSLEDAQTNAVLRMLARHGRLLEPEELRSAAKHDPGTFAPGVQFRYRSELEPPSLDEGFHALEELAFVRARDPALTRAALVFECDGVLRTSRCGARAPRDPDDVALVPGRAAELARLAAQGALLIGVAWQPAETGPARELAEATNARTAELLGLALPIAWCPHPAGPPACWCRKPLPGLGLVLARAHGLDLTRCTHVGRGPSDRTFAERLGMAYRDHEELFAAR